MPKVLIVDDERIVLESTDRLLAMLGYETAVASDARDILATIRRERPDVVLQDVRMPGLDLDVLLKTIRGDERIAHTPIVLFSASMEIFELQDRLKPAGILEKPFRPSDALAVIERVRLRGPLEPLEREEKLSA